MKVRKIKNQLHKLYETHEEYLKDNDIPAVPWREGKEGDWVLTDDNQVCQVIKRGFLTNGKNYYIRTLMGSYVCRKQEQMKGDMRKNMYSFSAKDIRPEEVLKNRKEATTKEFLFAKYIARGDDVVDAFIKAFPTNKRGYAERQSKLLLRQDRIKSLIREEIDKVMNEAEITPLYILERMKEIIEKPDAKDSDKVNVLKELIDVAGMKDRDTRQESLTLFQGFSQEQLDAIGKNDTKKIASATREVKK